MPYAEDFDLWWRIMSSNNKIGHLEEILCNYRLSESSISNVVKKKENYDTTTNIMLRNIKFYTGTGFKVSPEEAEALRHNFIPLEKEKNVFKLVRFMNKIDFINKCIFEKENLNYTSSEIQQFAKIKREEAMYYFYVRLPKWKSLYFLLRTAPFAVIIRRFLHSLKISS